MVEEAGHDSFLSLFENMKILAAMVRDCKLELSSINNGNTREYRIYCNNYSLIEIKRSRGEYRFYTRNEEIFDCAAGYEIVLFPITSLTVSRLYASNIYTDMKKMVRDIEKLILNSNL